MAQGKVSRTRSVGGRSWTHQTPCMHACAYEVVSLNSKYLSPREQPYIHACMHVYMHVHSYRLVNNSEYPSPREEQQPGQRFLQLIHLKTRSVCKTRMDAWKAGFKWRVRRMRGST